METDELNESELQFLVAQATSKLKTNERDVDALISLIELYLKLDNFSKARDAVEQLFHASDDEPHTVNSKGSAIVDAILHYWKTDKYVKRGSLRINISEDRQGILTRLTGLMEALVPVVGADVKQAHQIKLSYLRECCGRFQESLQILSDLISQQASDIDLTLVIFKAAVLLMHLGGNDTQAIEYLEFLADEPPDNDGYGRTHVLACLAVLYERAGDHYAVVLEQTYAALQENYSKDLEKGKKPVTNQKKLQEQLTKKTFSRSSEIWEILSVQAVDRCDYVMANQMTKKAAEKCPSKGSLHHLHAELLYLLGDKGGCIKAAERSFQLNPQSPELKNLLLHVNPEKWQDKMRTVAPSREEAHVEDELDHVERGKRHTGSVKVHGEDGSAGKDASWLARITASATEAVKDGLLAVANAKATAEQRAKAAAEKEKKRKERREKREKEAAEKEAKLKALADMGVLMTADGKPRKRDPAIDGPARPPRPVDIAPARPVIELIRSGNENIHIYDPVLRQLAGIQEQVKRDELAWAERKKRAKSPKGPKGKA